MSLPAYMAKSPRGHSTRPPSQTIFGAGLADQALKLAVDLFYSKPRLMVTIW